MNVSLAISDAASALKRYARGPSAPSASDAEIEEEIAFHIAERSRELQAAGHSEEEADRLARDRFGDPQRVAADCRRAADGGVSRLHVAHAASTAALVALLAGALFWDRSPPPVAAVAGRGWTGDVTGRVSDEAGTPLPGADVMVVVKAWPGGSFYQRAYACRTDGEGRFALPDVLPDAGESEIAVSAAAAEAALVSTYRSMDEDASLPIALRLPRTSGVSLTVEDAGRPITFAEVRPSRRYDAAGGEHGVYFDAAAPLVRLTDSRGVADLSYLRPGDRASLLVRPRGEDWRPVDVTVPPDGAAVARLNTARL